MAATQADYRHPLPSPPNNDPYQQSLSHRKQPATNPESARHTLTTAQQQQYQAELAERSNSGFYYSNSSQYANNSRAKPRTFSIQSHRSKTSANSEETPEEKQRRRLTSRADPTLPMNEAEPSAVAAMFTEPTATPLSALQHKDAFGNPIAEPDRSNPTRSRWERPLDTIRSFEAAIDGGYSRKSVYGSDINGSSAWNRRSSMALSTMHPRRRPESAYGGPVSRPMSMRANRPQYGPSAPSTARNSVMYEQGAYTTQPMPRHSRRDMHRMYQESSYGQYGHEQGDVYPMPNKDRSYETVASAAASGNSDPAGYQTDPTSSDNSSIRRASPPKRKAPANDYGIGFAPNYQPPSLNHYSSRDVSPTNTGRSHHPLPPPPPPPPVHLQEPAPPAVPKKGPSLLRRQPSRQQELKTEAPVERRKSWLARRFSRN
ncbi:hypothetical protein VHEMI02277 [[Torrubiella] hemipterigena]|uniref:DUF2406 domain protein n=1 Tax=[Torrubiella] hemipterigena TaxID=1531966 RepID=A0A0A1SP81_9HYPO|nr:hypothetical protein VHEMI02277 [[Torrubiella] hemipterigena]